MKIDSDSLTDAADAVAKVSAQHNITHLDVVIVNAAIATSAVPLLSVDPKDLDTVMATNVRGALVLFQAVMPLLQKAKEAGRTPKLVAVSAILGSIQGIEMWPMSFGAYSISKAALNFMVRKIAFEEEGRVVAGVVHQG